MPDRDTVIRGLTAIQDEAYDRWVHQQYHEDVLVTLVKENISDALALLKEQEPVKPTKEQIFSSIFGWVCGACSLPFISDNYKYCPHCGRKVKWDDT